MGIAVKLKPSSLKRARWSFFGRQKQQIGPYYRIWFKLIYDNENDENNDDNGDNVDDYGDENYQETDKYNEF